MDIIKIILGYIIFAVFLLGFPIFYIWCLDKYWEFLSGEKSCVLEIILPSLKKDKEKSECSDNILAKDILKGVTFIASNNQENNSFEYDDRYIEKNCSAKDKNIEVINTETEEIICTIEDE